MFVGYMVYAMINSQHGYLVSLYGYRITVQLINGINYSVRLTMWQTVMTKTSTLKYYHL